ncbi:MAG: multifunctional hydrolase/phosphatase/nucleotidase [Leptolyngbya foveolarum]|uniref:Multifunctional hydrolase/phosphatase/nucleotidase n=1 Tax=Leptolyngbya foveolarum TaxID=47253 RepID=A0A2W4U000_9CYAN|nr:MAG: multifunctional hydrolase/phosphatase/nucleotidase [Leptolyngbya foveolarum]
MTPSFTKIGSFASEIGAEITAYDSDRQLLYVVSGGTTIQIIELSDPTSPQEVFSLDIAQFGVPINGANSIAYKNNLLAVAIAADPITDPGIVALIDLTAVTEINAAGGNILDAVKTFTVGALPDMLTFSPDGSKVLVANEGEAVVEVADDGAVTVTDPEGSVSIIDVSGDFSTLGQSNVATADFSRFNGQEADLRGDGVRIFPDATTAQDVEPEYIAVSPDGTKAFVTLQENNAIAIVDVASATVEAIQPLGLKDYSLSGLDASDKDDAINIQPQPVFGLYMPDAIASFESNGETFYLIANEGDDRGDADADPRGDAIRLKDLADVTSFGRSGLSLDPAFEQQLLADGLLEDEALGRLTLSSIDGDTDGDGDIDRLVSYGGRSFSVLDSNGNIVFDSGDQIERITAELTPELFNANDGDPAEVDARSDNKGPEPETVTTGVIDGKLYAFVSLERAGGGVLVYDLADPRQPEFVQYFRSDEDIAPEGLTFISAENSPNGQPLLAVANEVSNTIALYSPDVSGGPINGPELTSIYAIQGAGQVSALVDMAVVTSGIVTAVDTNGFYLQDAVGDGNLATSDALFVFTSDVPSVTVGDELQVAGMVSEFTPGGASTGNLSTTQISGNPVITTLSTGNALPVATIIGSGGRVPPAENIDDDAFGAFEPATDGIDFFESLEAMRVTAEDLLVVNGTNRFGEIFAVANQGANASGLSDRQTLNISPDDLNPERIQINQDTGVLPGFSLPTVDVGALLGNVTGVVSYGFGNFEILPTEAFTVVADSTLTPETTALTNGDDQLTIASYNVLNLDINDGDGDTDVADGRFEAIAQQIINNLGTPDIVGLQEIQDNSGSADDGTIAADATLQALVEAIAQAGGPTYQFIDNTFIGNNTSGGQPGGNIRTAFLYNPERVTSVGEAKTIGDQIAGSPFEGARLPLVATFAFNGENVTVVNNHFSSKGGSAPILGTSQDFVARQEDPSVNGSLDERREQAQAVNNFVDGVLTNDADANVVVLGDLNEFEFVSPLQILEGTTVSTSGGQAIETGGSPVLTNLINNIPEDERYSFIFQGNSQELDHILVSDALAARADIDIVHVNTERAEIPQLASDHDPVLTRLNLGEAPTMENFQLQLLHLSDQEAGIPALQDAPRASAVLNALRDDYENTLVLSSGDAYIPGVFFSASEDAFGGAGRADILIQNELGLQAIAFGNHEFDLGPDRILDLIGGAEDDPATPDVDESFIGAQFPYLSSNLDFSASVLAGLVVPDDQAPVDNSIAATTVIDVNGQSVGVVGATTPTLPTLSIPGDVAVEPQTFAGDPTPEQLDALAAEIQTDVDELLAANPGLDKVVLISHFQQISIEQAIATRLSNVDVIVAGGSNTRLLDETDRLRDGDTTQGEYPIFSTDADGKPIAIVNTDGNYKYIGRLVVEFDANGNIIPESYDAAVSGAYAADDQGVAELNAGDLVDPEIQGIVDALNEVIVAKESNVFGVSTVYLNGRRESIRTEETNLGNLTADANLAIAKATDPTVTISIKNGGGIRDQIGRVFVPAGSTGEADLLTTEAIPGVKPEGGISENDIGNSLRFNNGLSLLTVTAAELLEIIEYGVAASTPDDSTTEGRFPQVAGIQFSFDLTAAAGDRVQSLVVLDEDGNDMDVIAQDGELVGDSDRTFRLVTLGFLAEGGDGYTFPMRDVVNLTQPDDAPRTGAATFAPDGSEQDALAEYLAATFGADSPFDQVDTSRAEDTRLQNLAFRADTVIDGIIGGGGGPVEPIPASIVPQFNFASAGGAIVEVDTMSQIYFGGDGDDFFDATMSKSGNRIFGRDGDDLILGGANDIIVGGAGDDILFAGEGGNTLTGGAGADQFWVAYGGIPIAGNIITDFTAGTDVIGFGGISDVSSFSDVQLVQSGADTRILSPAGGLAIAVLNNVAISALTESSFAFA